MCTKIPEKSALYTATVEKLLKSRSVVKKQKQKSILKIITRLVFFHFIFMRPELKIIVKIVKFQLKIISAQYKLKII